MRFVANQRHPTKLPSELLCSLEVSGAGRDVSRISGKRHAEKRSVIGFSSHDASGELELSRFETERHGPAWCCHNRYCITAPTTGLLSRGSQVQVLPGALLLPEGLRPSDSPARALAGTPAIPAPRAWLTSLRSFASPVTARRSDTPGTRGARRGRAPAAARSERASDARHFSIPHGQAMDGRAWGSEIADAISGLSR